MAKISCSFDDTTRNVLKQEQILSSEVNALRFPSRERTRLRCGLVLYCAKSPVSFQRKCCIQPCQSYARVCAKTPRRFGVLSSAKKQSTPTQSPHPHTPIKFCRRGFYGSQMRVYRNAEKRDDRTQGTEEALRTPSKQRAQALRFDPLDPCAS